MKTTALAFVAIVSALAATSFAACRHPDNPSGDPKTPANSPIPKIEKDDEPATSPASPSPPTIGDAG